MPSKVDKYRLSRKNDRRCRATDDDVQSMRELYCGGITQKTIADIFGVSQSTVSYIVSSQARANLAEYRKINPPKRRTKEEARDYARELRSYKRGLVARDIAEGKEVDLR